VGLGKAAAFVELLLVVSKITVAAKAFEFKTTMQQKIKTYRIIALFDFIINLSI
jgi:hypothetical protein